jgi:hypothetical protein
VVDRKNSDRLGPIASPKQICSSDIKINGREGFLGKKDRRRPHAEEKDRQDAISQAIKMISVQDNVTLFSPFEIWNYMT